MHRFKNLKVWQKAMELAERVFVLTRDFPEEEKFGLIAQIRRSAVSVPSNIAEGAGRNSNQDFARFLNIANGSINELETQLLLAERLGFVEKDKLEETLSLVAEVQKMNYAMTKRLKNESGLGSV
ncbi:four helix bundle protein [Croceimicrobium sp.]|uniref:four helix bundle protein n=1 Tax=Croceimicrobium sp. TaxID=2828340 RepID=UPI003BA8B9CC